MNAYVEELKPYRWKVFQCLLINGENAGPSALRDAKEMLVTTEEF
jgi:radical S-adenosyl methionine domain-containing protein 2